MGILLNISYKILRVTRMFQADLHQSGQIVAYTGFVCDDGVCLNDPG